jgi:cysteine desulfurase family protein (TIGR01976 family)
MTKVTLDSVAIRKQFPSLKRKHNGKPLIFIDGPAGTQIPQSVIDGMVSYYENSNSNTHGTFITTNETDAVIKNVRQSMATLLGAEGIETISVGQNMTTLNFALARGMSRFLKAGDEVLITQLDHEANRGPWLTLRDAGIKVREIKLLPNGNLDYKDFEAKMNENTRLVCMGMSSNSLGTVNDFKLARELTYRYNAWLLLDAVHYAPHFAIDVQAIGCDFLLCSAYKFYGPHIGILYSRPGLLDRIPTDRLRTADQMAPFCIETGTLNHAALAGVSSAVDFIAKFGKGTTKREKIVSAYESIAVHEHTLASRLYSGLKKISGVTLIGQDFSSASRTPTVSFIMKGKTPEQVCTALAAKNICAWDGHFYALRAIEILGLAEKGGVTRMGISLYNTVEEIDYVLEVVKGIAKG